MKRWMVVLIVLVVVAAGVLGVGAYLRSRAQAATASLRTVEAVTGDLTALVGASGSVRANQSAVLAFQTTGTVERVSVVVGQTVQAGEELASLEMSSLPAQVLAAQADLVAARRALDTVRNSSLARAQAELALAQARDALHTAEYRRTVQQQGNRASGNTIDAARARLVLAEDRVRQMESEYGLYSGRSEDDPARALALQNLASARQERDAAQRALNWYLGHPTEIGQAILDANVAVAEAQVADAEREWARVQDGPDPEDVAAADARVAAAEASINLSHITAPFSGTITSVGVMPGDQVAPGTVAFGLADLSRLLIDVQVSEVDIENVRAGQAVTVTLDAAPDRTYHGEVTEVGLTGMSVQGVVDFDVTVELQDADDVVRPGMTAAASIVVNEIHDVLLIPNRAVRVQDGQRIVYVLRDGQIAVVPIVLGASSETDSQVLEGDLQSGDLIVLNPPLVLDTSGPPSFVGMGGSQ